MIGDVLTSTILFEALRTSYPDAELHYLINTHTYPVVENNPTIDKCIFFSPDLEKDKIKIFGFAKKLRQNQYDIVIDAYSKLSSNIISLMSGAEKRISYDKYYSRFCYTNTIDRRIKRGQILDNLAIKTRLELLSPLGIKNLEDIKPKIYLTDDEKAQAIEVLKINGLSLSHPIVMISALGSGPLKTYPYSYLAKVIDTVVDSNPNIQFLFNYIPKQAGEAREIFDLCLPKTQSKIYFNVFGKSLREFLGLVSKCAAVVGNEGGAINMSKALEVPTFSIFSPWNAKSEWSIFENDTTDIAVHLEDYKPEYFQDISKYKELKPKTQSLYQEFKPELFDDKLRTFINTISKN